MIRQLLLDFIDCSFLARSTFSSAAGVDL